jgi:cytoskeletal protein CcmA (bactofilin family)
MFDTKAARSTGETRFPDFDVKSQATPATPRVDPKPAVEAKADGHAVPEAQPQGSVLGATLHFKGELRADEDFVLQGRVEGSIHHTQNLTIGTDGVVKGDSRALTIVVEGTVDGDLYALESISIRPTAKVHGNLLAPRVAIADGASFNGKVDMASAARAVRTIAERHSTTLEAPAVDQVLSAGADFQGS